MTTATRSERATTGDEPHALPSIGVVIVAAGSGARLGAATPKAFVRLGGRTLIEHCIRAVRALPHSGYIVVVVPDSHAAEALRIIDRLPVETGANPSDWTVSITHGGRERHESVRFGLDALPDRLDIVLVHDAARPLAPAELFDRVIDEVHRRGCAVIPALPVVDTLKRVDGEGVVHETVDRAPLVAVQTPQGFPQELIAAAHEELRILKDRSSTGAETPTDDAEVVQRAGGTVRIVRGDALAHKLTTQDDLMLLEAMHTARADAEEELS